MERTAAEEWSVVCALGAATHGATGPAGPAASAHQQARRWARQPPHLLGHGGTGVKHAHNGAHVLGSTNGGQACKQARACSAECEWRSNVGEEMRVHRPGSRPPKQQQLSGGSQHTMPNSGYDRQHHESTAQARTCHAATNDQDLGGRHAAGGRDLASEEAAKVLRRLHHSAASGVTRTCDSEQRKCITLVARERPSAALPAHGAVRHRAGRSAGGWGHGRRMAFDMLLQDNCWQEQLLARTGAFPASPVARNVGHGGQGVKGLGATDGTGDAVHACKMTTTHSGRH